MITTFTILIARHLQERVKTNWSGSREGGPQFEATVLFTIWGGMLRRGWTPLNHAAAHGTPGTSGNVREGTKARELGVMAHQHCQQGILNSHWGNSCQQLWVLMVEWCSLQPVRRSTLPSWRGYGEECTVPGDVHPSGHLKDPKPETA